MSVIQKSANNPWLYDSVTGDIVGIKDPDGSELLFMRIPHIGAFYDAGDQTALVDTATAMTCDTVQISRGITVVDQTKFTVSRKASYNIQFSAQFFNPESSDYRVSVWPKVNGTNVEDSCTDITVPSKHGFDSGAVVAAWNFFLDLNAGDYVELMWSTPIATITMEHTAARTTPVRPAIPSLIVTINEVDGSYPA